MDQDKDPRWIRLRPSRIHLAVTVGGALAAGVIVALLPLPAWARLALIAATALFTACEIRRTRLRGVGTATAFYLFDLDSAAVMGRNAVARTAQPALAIRLRTAARKGKKRAAEVDGVVLSGAYVTPWFTSLPYRLADDPQWRQCWPRIIALWPDSLDAEAFRRVRVQLKWK